MNGKGLLHVYSERMVLELLLFLFFSFLFLFLFFFLIHDSSCIVICFLRQEGNPERRISALSWKVARAGFNVYNTTETIYTQLVAKWVTDIEYD